MTDLYQCTRCHRETTAGTAITCERGPCPMDLVTSANCTLCAPGSNEERSPGFYHGCMCNDEPGGVVNGWTCDGKGKLTRAGSIPDGMMLVSKAWQPIMDEVERRAEKMDGNTDDFTVTIRAEDYRDILM